MPGAAASTLRYKRKGFRHDSPTIFRDVLEWDTFGGRYPNYAAWATAIGTRGTAGSNLGGLSFASSPTFNGNSVLDKDMTVGGGLAIVELSVTARTRLWGRMMIRLSSDAAVGDSAGYCLNWLGYDSGAYNSGTDFSMASGRWTDSSMAQSVTGGAADIALMKERWCSVVVCMEPQRNQLFFNGIRRLSNSLGYGTDKTFSIVEACWGMQNVAVTTGHIYCGLFELIDGNKYPDPYGIL